MQNKIRDVMIQDVKVIDARETILKTAQMMNQHEISSLIVIKKDKPVGIITERDILKRVVAEKRKPEVTKANDVMTKPLITVKPNSSITKAIRLMIRQNVKKLVVTDSDNLLGILSLTDLLPVWDKIQQKNKISLNKVPKHMKKTFELYYDPVRQIRKRCPLTISGGTSISCIGQKCMWFVDERCVFLNLAKA
jgi:CBS domain-containing protein